MSVDRRVDIDNRVLFPNGISIKDSLIGHLEFGLRHEGLHGNSLRRLVEPIVTRSPVGGASRYFDASRVFSPTATPSQQGRVGLTSPGHPGRSDLSPPGP
jgi:hypothetical protein